MNNVDISEETVKKEWDNLAVNFKLNTEEVAEEVNDEDVEILYSIEDIAEKEEITSGLIQASLVVVLAMFDIQVDEDITKEFAKSWAVVIVKRFPDNPITDFMAEYGDLIGAGSATLILIGAIKKSKQIKKAEIKEKVANQINKEIAEVAENGQ